MTLAPLAVTMTVDGWVEFAGELEWAVAKVSVSPEDATLLVRRADGADAADAVRIELATVTALDELLAERPGFHHVEIAVDGHPALQAVWPVDFTPHVLDALASTVEGPGGSSTPGAAPTRRRANAGLIVALALAGVGALIVGALGLRSDPPTQPVDTRVLTQTTIRGTEASVPSTTTGRATTAVPSTTTTSTTTPE